MILHSVPMPVAWEEWAAREHAARGVCWGVWARKKVQLTSDAKRSSSGRFWVEGDVDEGAFVHSRAESRKVARVVQVQLL